MSPSSPKPGDTYVQSFARGLEVIRSFSSHAPEQTLSEVASATGLTRAGARRILLTLQTLGYVSTPDGKWFRLTPRILDLGFAYLSSMPIWNSAGPIMENLVAELRESCSAAVLEGHDVVYVLRVATHKIMRTNLGVGSRLPAVATSMGRVLLGALPDDQLRERIESSPRPAHTEYTVTGVNALMALVQQARRQGWCLINQELEEGLISIAAPVIDRSGQIVAAVNVSGQANRTSPQAMQEHMLPALLRAAQAISRTLGAHTG